MNEFDLNLNKAKNWNDAFDKSIIANKCVSLEQFTLLQDAFESDSASSIQWLNSKLKLIRSHIDGKNSIKLNNSNEEIKIENQLDFMKWIEGNFNKFICDEVYK